MGGNLPVDSAIFLGMLGAELAYLGSLVDCLWDFNYRIYTRDTPISTDSLVCLVGSRPTSWQSGAPYISFSLPHRFLSKG